MKMVQFCALSTYSIVCNIVVYSIDMNPLLLFLYNINCSAYVRMSQIVHSNVLAGNNNLTVFQFVTIFYYMLDSSLRLSYLLTQRF